jgi:hypothetical protein
LVLNRGEPIIELIADYTEKWITGARRVSRYLCPAEQLAAVRSRLWRHQSVAKLCSDKAAAQGIRVDRARSGFLELERFVREARSGKRLVDGYYVELWRLMLAYPELLAWENLWHDSLRDTYQAIYKKVKSLKPAMGVGWHIWHNNSFSPLYRAEQDLHRIAPYSDF